MDETYIRGPRTTAKSSLGEGGRGNHWKRIEDDNRKRWMVGSFYP